MADSAVLLTRNFDHKVEVRQHGALILVKAKYHAEIVEALKGFDRSRWLSDTKEWAFPATLRNLWSLRAMEEGGPMDPYLKVSKPWTPLPPRTSKLLGQVFHYEWQLAALPYTFDRKQVIIGAEPRTGKTLYYMEVMERVPGLWWFVAPVKVLDEIRIQIDDFGSPCKPILMSYDDFRVRMENLKEEDVPVGVIYDEGSKLKGHSQRTKAAVKLAEMQDRKYGERECYRILGTGTPQPKDELDWYFLTEAVRPGFIPLGNIYKFTEWMQIRCKAQGIHGNDFWQFVQWKDGGQCLQCSGTGKSARNFQCGVCLGKGVVEDNMSVLKEWLSCICMVVLKKDVMEIPDKDFYILTSKPGKDPAYHYLVDPRYAPPTSMVNVARVIAEQGGTAVHVMEKHAQLADGFQYVNDPVTGKLLKTLRGKTPKDFMLSDLLAKHEEVGRFVVFTAYQETTDKVVELCLKAKWNVIRCDGKAAKCSTGIPFKDGLLEFRRGVRDSTNKWAFVGHPGSGGYGLNLAKSPGFFWYSLGFNGEHYTQGIERGHSKEMDFERGCTIYIGEVLPTDILRRGNVTGKKKKQDYNMGEIQSLMRVAA